MRHAEFVMGTAGVREAEQSTNKSFNAMLDEQILTFDITQTPNSSINARSAAPNGTGLTIAMR